MSSRSSTLASATAVLLALLASCTHTSTPGHPPRPRSDKTRPHDFFTTAPDPATAIPAATSQALQTGRHVLLVFGADWCSDSRAMIDRLSRDTAIAARITAHYLLVPIDVGERHGPLWDAELVQRYDRPFEGRGIPALVVLDGLGNQLTDASNNPLRDSSHRHPRRLIRFLDRWAPPVGPTSSTDLRP